VTIVNNVIALHTKIQCNNSSFFGRGLIRKDVSTEDLDSKQSKNPAVTALEALRLKFDGLDIKIIK
jgi:hypothetical protein